MRPQYFAEISKLTVSAKNGNPSTQAVSTHRSLYGGAITCDIPSDWCDLSQVRQVPDHQEVYQDCSLETDGAGACVIFEILEREGHIRNEEAALYFFDDLADANSAPTEDDGGRILLTTKVFESKDRMIGARNENAEDSWMLLPNLPTANCDICFGLGRQEVVEGGVSVLDPRAKHLQRSVIIEMCILRLESLQTDLVISLTTPISNKTTHMINPSYTTGIAKIKEQKGRHKARKQKPRHESRPCFSPTFRNVVSSFEVQDWTLMA